MTAPSPGGVQRWELAILYNDAGISAHPIGRHDGDWVRYGDIAGMVAKITEERDEAMADAERECESRARMTRSRDTALAENTRLRKALELASRVVQSFANAERFEAINEARLDLIDDLAEALRGAAGEVGK